MNNNDQEFLVQKIRTQYTEKQHTELDALKALDAKVKRPANVFAYSYGSVGAIVMGAGMSLVMTEIGAMIGLASTMIPGIAVGIAGLGMALTNYPIYKRVLNSRKKKYAAEILSLSETLLQGQKTVPEASATQHAAENSAPTQLTNEAIRESGVMPEIVKAMEHDVSDVPGVDPVAAYKAIEEGVVGAYKAVEKGAVEAYRKVEDTMVDKLFRKEGETVAQAKERLNKK